MKLEGLELEVLSEVGEKPKWYDFENVEVFNKEWNKSFFTYATSIL